MYLDRILGTATRVNTLSELLANPDEPIIENRLAKRAGMAASGVHKQVKALVECGLVRMHKVGRSNQYSVNTKHFLYKPLRALFQDLNAAYKRMAMEITAHATKKHGIDAVILIGSANKKTVRQDYVNNPSDLDLVIIGKDTEGIARDVAGYAAEKAVEYGVNCYPIVLTQEEYRERLKKDDPFTLNAQAEGELLYGKKPSRLG